MQIIEIYDKNCNLKSNGKNVFKTMNSFLNKYPTKYRNLYDQNLLTLELFKCDELDDLLADGMYDKTNNIVYFVKSKYIGHELFHMASTDRCVGVAAIESQMDCEEGMIEGMTEYLFMKAFDLKGPTAYEFETFAVDMLTNMPDLFKHYFIPNHSEFIKMFPNRKDIYNLIFAIGTYHENYMADYLCDEKRNPIIGSIIIKKSIRQVINNLITIELSFGKERHELVEYSRKFMDLIGSYDLCSRLSHFYPEYYLYAEKQIKERILKR